MSVNSDNEIPDDCQELGGYNDSTCCYSSEDEFTDEFTDPYAQCEDFHWEIPDWEEE